MSSPVIILVILPRWAEKPFQGKPFGLKQGQVEWVLKKRDQLNVILICLSSSSSSCLVGRRNLFRENLPGAAQVCSWPWSAAHASQCGSPPPSYSLKLLPNPKVTTLTQLWKRGGGDVVSGSSYKHFELVWAFFSQSYPCLPVWIYVA